MDRIRIDDIVKYDKDRYFYGVVTKVRTEDNGYTWVETRFVYPILVKHFVNGTIVKRRHHIGDSRNNSSYVIIIAEGFHCIAICKQWGEPFKLVPEFVPWIELGEPVDSIKDLVALGDPDAY